jgi:hypothetical protein
VKTPLDQGGKMSSAQVRATVAGDLDDEEQA